MKKLALLPVFIFCVFAVSAQIPPAPPTPPTDPIPPAGPSINIADEQVTIIDKRGNTYVINDYGITRNGVMITGDDDYLEDEVDDLQDDIDDLEDEVTTLDPQSDEYQELMEDINELEEELNQLSMERSNTMSPDTLPDSTTVTIGPWRITVTEDEEGGDDVSLAKVDGDDDGEIDRDVDVIETKWFLFDLGYNTYLGADHTTEIAGDEYDILEDQQTWGSWDVNVHVFRQRINIANGYLNFNYGLSFEWHNFRYNSDFVILPNMDTVTISFADEEGQPYDFKKNRFSTTHFTLPLILGFETKPWDTDHSFRMGFGYSPGLMIKGKTKIVEGGDTQKVKDDFNLEKFRHELNYIIGFGGLNLYASYDLNGMFKEGEGPELHPFSVGIIINRGF